MTRSALLLLCAACAAGSALGTLPRSQIDRPYTLPRGVDDWFVAPVLTTARDSTARRSPVLDLKLGWALALADDWQLDVGPPLGLSLQLAHDGRHRAGATLTFNSGLEVEHHKGDGNRLDVLFGPLLHLEDQVRLSRRWAWNIGASGELWKWTYQPLWAWSAQLATGPIVQIAETLQLQSLFSLAQAHDYASLYSPKVPADRIEAGALVAALWSISRQWDLGLRGGATWFGNANGYRETWASLTATAFW